MSAERKNDPQHIPNFSSGFSLDSWQFPRKEKTYPGVPYVSITSFDSSLSDAMFPVPTSEIWINNQKNERVGRNQFHLQIAATIPGESIEMLRGAGMLDDDRVDRTAEIIRSIAPMCFYDPELGILLNDQNGKLVMAYKPVSSSFAVDQYRRVQERADLHTNREYVLKTNNELESLIFEYGTGVSFSYLTPQLQSQTLNVTAGVEFKPYQFDSLNVFAQQCIDDNLWTDEPARDIITPFIRTHVSPFIS